MAAPKGKLSATHAAAISNSLGAAADDFLYNPDAQLSELFPDVTGDAELLDSIFEVYEAVLQYVRLLHDSCYSNPHDGKLIRYDSYPNHRPTSQPACSVARR